jgi:GNAT superfamily N-acetyltransferase
MPIEQYQLLPRKAGWSYAYIAGKAHITPCPFLVRTRVAVTLRPVPPELRLEPLDPAQDVALARAFVAAFRDAIEYCDVSLERLRDAARTLVADFFAGKRGTVDAASRCLRDGRRIAGAAMITRVRRGLLLDVLLVRPKWQRRGLATALVAAALDDLRARGESVLHSTYHPGNEASAAWHARFGFVDEPDPQVASMRAALALQEIERRQAEGTLDEATGEQLWREHREQRELAKRLWRGLGPPGPGT